MSCDSLSEDTLMQQCMAEEAQKEFDETVAFFLVQQAREHLKQHPLRACDQSVHRITISDEAWIEHMMLSSALICGAGLRTDRVPDDLATKQHLRPLVAHEARDEVFEVVDWVHAKDDFRMGMPCTVVSIRHR